MEHFNIIHNNSKRAVQKHINQVKLRSMMSAKLICSLDGGYLYETMRVFFVFVVGDRVIYFLITLFLGPEYVH